MMHVVRAEWCRLMRRGSLLGAGVVVALGTVAASVIFGQAAIKPDPAQPQAVAIALLEAPDGLVQAFGFASQIVGAASLVLFARSVTTDYQQGTLKVLLTREPRRLVFLAGKGVAMAAFVVAAVLATVVAMVVTAMIAAATRGFDLSAWWSLEGFAAIGLGTLRLAATALVWGLVGTALGTTLRSAGAAIGIGIGVLAIGGHIVERFFTNASEWFPSLVLAAFTVGGTPAVSLALSGIVAAAYAVGLAIVAGIGFKWGDVPG